ncbi:MAG: hypothetical protein IPP94_12195 [Ignavibacteria bacterium]|nr:hypothetical protein [Ignavibacteria bacterium]
MAMQLMNADDAVRQIQPKISKAKGRLTVADAAAATGLAIEDVRTGLEAMMNRFVCRLQVTESGEILYDFGASLRRRGSKTAKEILADIGDVLWRGFKVLFKIWITVMLLVYFVFFVIVAIALALAASSKSDSDFSLDWVGDLFVDLFAAAGRGMIIVSMTDSYGYQHRGYQQVSRRNTAKAEKSKRLVQSVYDFVFGPPRPDFDPFANEKEVLSWLRDNNGVLTTTEIVALAGWTYAESEERMADYLTRFKGNADITEEGVLIGKFEQVLAKGDANLEGGKVELFWHEFEAPYQVTGNTGGKNAMIAGMNAFTLIMSCAVLFSSSAEAGASIYIGDSPGMWSTIHFVLGWIPFLFSFLFFLVPLIRSFDVRTQEARRLDRNKRRRIMRVIFDTAGYPLTLSDIVAAVNRGGQAAMDAREVERILGSVLIDIHGTTELREDGTLLYRFPRIERETAAVNAIRKAGGATNTLGDVIIDTGK